MRCLEVLDLCSFAEISQESIINNSLDGLKGRLKGLGINACSPSELDKLNELSMPVTILKRWIRKWESGPSLDLLPRRKHPRDPTWSSMKYLEVTGEYRGVVEGGLIELERDRPLETLVVHESYSCFPKHLIVTCHDELEEIVWKGVKDRGTAAPMLASVTINGCIKLKHLSWLLNLPLLTVLNVSSCHRMEHVIWEEEEEAREIEHEHQVPAIFPALRALRLRSLPALKSISNGRAVSLPCLEYLRVFECPRLKRLPFDTPASCRRLKKIEAEREWWEDTLELNGRMRTHLQSRFAESLY